MTDKPQIANRTLFTGDNLDVMRAMNSESVDLIYLDPPFNKKYVFPIGKGKDAEFGFTDIWGFGKGKDDPYLLETELNAYNELMWAGLFGAPTIGKADAETLLDFVKVAGKIGGESAAAYLSFMAIRLLEMKRVLKPTGSIYLHCDQTMSHSIKLLMDIVFGADMFRNEIIWHYGGRGGKSIAKQFPRNSDVIFFYTRNLSTRINRQTWTAKIPLRDSGYRQDESGRYFRTAPRGHYTNDSICQLEKEGRIYRTRSGNIRIKYFEESDGEFVYEKKQVGNVWNDIPDAMHSPKSERVGYPTQKPVSLLERIIQASSNEGDLILDPFCGCATTCIAAERLGRRWVGVDVAKQAANLVKKRLDDETEQGKLGDKVPQVHHIDFRNADDRPSRTDIAGMRSPDAAIRMRLYGVQGGNCALCGTHFDHNRHFHLDHKTPKAKGGPDIDANLQLLCAHCNAVKGDRTMAQARELLQKWGYAA